MSTRFLSFHPASELFLKAGQLALVFLPWPAFVVKVEGSYSFLTVCVEVGCIVVNVGVLPYIQYL